MSDKEEKIRIQFDVAQDVIDRMDAMRKTSGASTNAEVVRNALKMYEWVLECPNARNSIEIKNPAGETIASGLLLGDILPE